ncbi:hypothetical protein HID58_023864, partial [Brassica napus]
TKKSHRKDSSITFYINLHLHPSSSAKEQTLFTHTHTHNSKKQRDQKQSLHMSADWGPVIVAVSLFILLSPGLLFQIPARTRVVEFGNMSTSGIAILVHAVIYFCILTILVIAIQIRFHKGFTPLLHTNKGNRERPRRESTGVDVEIDGDDQNGVYGEEDESVNSYGFSVGFESTARLFPGNEKRRPGERITNKMTPTITGAQSVIVVV